MVAQAGSDLTKELATSIQRRLASLSPVSSSCCIYRLPAHHLKVDKDAYCLFCLCQSALSTMVIQKLEPIKEQKLRYLQSFLLRNNAYNNIDYYVEAIRGWEQVTHQCYITTVGFPSVTFIEMVLVDALIHHPALSEELVPRTY